MGQRHANNFLNLTPRAELVAAFSPDSREIAWAKENLEPYGVTLYMDYDEMLNTKHAIKAIAVDKHVLSEKPLMVDAATKKPHLKVMCGFSRRFDPSYRDVKGKIDAGLIGKPIVFMAKQGTTRSFSGGIFVDCTIHDIDLALWFFGEENVVKSIYAAGVTAIEPGLRQYNDCDNAVGIVEFYSGQIAYFYVTRMMAAGQEDQTFIVGTEGKLTVNQNPAINLVQIHDKSGVRRQIPQNYFERFSEGFTREANQFTAAVLYDLPTPLDPQGAVHAVKIARALQESMTRVRR
ncbi:hypothetical protein V1515DRAFT_626423 [Lipomyces mesembrius]